MKNHNIYKISTQNKHIIYTSREDAKEKMIGIIMTIDDF